MNKKESLIKWIDEKSPGAKPILIAIRGSRAYGTFLPTSDTDYSGIYIQAKDDILGFGYKEQINDDKNDTVFYEIKRFLELINSNNPNILELLNTPTDCMIYKDPIYDIILENKDKFITKGCAKSFGGYAFQQIKKAKGQNKKQNWEENRIERKHPIDFCYIHIREKSIPLTKWLEDNKMDQKFCGLSKTPHSRDTYALFYDKLAYRLFSSKSSELFKIFLFLFNNKNVQGFKGIGFEDSNDIKLSSIPIDCPKSYFKGYVSYNKDGYSTHCDEFRSYTEWLENKNDQRWVDVKSHGQKIDGKNMMHCRRLLEMAKEISEGKGINVRRENAAELISIRKGEVDLQSLIDQAESDIKTIDDQFANSNLPEKVDQKLIDTLLIAVRNKFY